MLSLNVESPRLVASGTTTPTAEMMVVVVVVVVVDGGCVSRSCRYHGGKTSGGWGFS